MNRNLRYSLITVLADELRARGSWSGETHLQKAVFLLREIGGLDLGYDFVLYRHGPFSFDLHDEIISMRVTRFLDTQRRPGGYGPTLITTDLASAHLAVIQPIDADLDRIRSVASLVGDAGVSELERLTTAVYLTRTEGGTLETRAGRMHSIKPHIPIESAREALARVDELLLEPA